MLTLSITHDVLLFHVAPFLNLHDLGKLMCCNKYFAKNMPDEFFKPFALPHVSNKMHFSWHHLAKKIRSRYLIIGSNSAFTDPVMRALGNYLPNCTLWDCTTRNQKMIAMSQMLNYDAVFVFGDGEAFCTDENCVELGNNLDTYVHDFGGGLVTGSFANCNNVTSGHIKGSMLQLMPIPIGTQSSITSSGVLVPTQEHFIFVNTQGSLPRKSKGDSAKGSTIQKGQIICTFGNSNDTVAAGTLQHGKGTIVSFNFFPYMSEAQEDVMFVNALLFVNVNKFVSTCNFFKQYESC